jgi:regulator of sigma E protease
MVITLQILQFVIIISLLVILHELGHFIPAKLFKTKVEKFYLFFDVKFSLFKKKIGDTVYGIGWLPLGGYVKIAGMIDESMDKEQMALPPKPWEFRSKPIWQRLIIMIGGVTVNFFLAWFIYSTLLVVEGDTYTPTESLRNGLAVNETGELLGFQNGDQIIAIDGKPVKRFNEARIDIILGDEATVKRKGEKITFPLADEGKKMLFENPKGDFISIRYKATIGDIPDSTIAKKADLQKGDVIVMANGKPIHFWDDFQAEIKAVNDDSLSLVIERGRETIKKNIYKPTGEILGVRPNITKEYIDELEITDEYGILASIPEGFNKTINVLVKQIKQFKVIANTKTGAYKQVKGPIGIVEMMSPTWDWSYFWSFTAMFSVWLAFINILPIPALDGGHVMFLLYEMISGRKPSEKVLEYGQIAGFIFLMGLMAVIFGNDIWNIVKRFF